MGRPFSPRFAVYIAIVFLILGTVQLAASLGFYLAIDRQTLRDDHARRIAELLVVSDRVHAIAPGQTAASMSSRHLAATVATTPSVSAPSRKPLLTSIANNIFAWEPSLANRSLRLALVGAPHGAKDLIGSIRLSDGSWLNFRSRDITSSWPIAWRAGVLTLVSTVAFLMLGLIMLSRLARPLRRLADAAEAVGQGREVTVHEEGPRDLRDLAHAMNGMQARIALLLRDQARTFEAISHDLRTPLARQKVVADLIDDRELAGLLHASVGEMDDLLSSLQAFMRAQHLSVSPELVPLAGFLREILGGYGGKISLITPVDPIVRTFREPLTLAILALVENAMRFADNAVITLERNDGEWAIAIADDGPGIPPEYFEAVLDPFFRLDEARARNTKGFGLGIPTAHRLMLRFDGKLAFATGDNGGLVVKLTVPVA